MPLLLKLPLLLLALLVLFVPFCEPTVFGMARRLLGRADEIVHLTPTRGCDLARYVSSPKKRFAFVGFARPTATRPRSTGATGATGATRVGVIAASKLVEVGDAATLGGRADTGSVLNWHEGGARRTENTDTPTAFVTQL